MSVAFRGFCHVQSAAQHRAILFAGTEKFPAPHYMLAGDLSIPREHQINARPGLSGVEKDQAV